MSADAGDQMANSLGRLSEEVSVLEVEHVLSLFQDLGVVPAEGEGAEVRGQELALSLIQEFR